jgi:hypothetical protein
MFTVQFVGRAFHAPVGFSLDSPTLTLNEPEQGHRGQTDTYHLRISDDVATLTCNTTHYDAQNLLYFYFRGLHFTQACLALFTFSTGLGATVAYEKWIRPDGREEPIFFNQPRVKDYCTSYSLPKDFNEMLTLSVGNTELIYAIVDVTKAISEPITAAFGGARALERIRTLVAGPDEGPKEAWGLMQTALRVDKAYLQFVTDHSVAPRHGQDFTHTAEVNQKVIERCWTIIDRAIIFVKRGRQPLPAEEFPLLTG